MNINEKLKVLRRGQTQKETAKNLGISYASYNKYETTNTMPDIENLINIADYYKITLDSLVGHEVPYLLDKSILSEKQKKVLETTLKLSDMQCQRLLDFATGMLSEEK